jgi:hypothetical protein
VTRKKKIPEDAFTIYVAMQEERSYQALADRFGVTERAIQKVADQERWSERLAQIERRHWTADIYLLPRNSQKAERSQQLDRLARAAS